MLKFLIQAFTFVVSNSRMFLTIGVILGGAVIAHNVYNHIVVSAKNEVRIEQMVQNEKVYRSTIESQKDAIAAQKKAAEILNEEIDKREEALRIISIRSDKIKETANGPGGELPASDYMRELIRTMGETP